MVDRKPLVSVIMPAYNHEKFVGEAIESVLNQTLSDLELIVIDDGSTDDTVNVIKKFKDSRIKFYSQENRGSAATLNRGIKMAQGGYIAIINSDDVFAPERLETLLAYAENSGYRFVVTLLKVIDERSNILSEASQNSYVRWFIPWYESLVDYYNQCGQPATALLNGNFAITSSNFFFSASIINDIGLFTPYRYVLDYDFIFRASRNDPRSFSLCNQELLFYRIHGNNTITQNELLAMIEAYPFVSGITKELLGPSALVPLKHLEKLNSYVVDHMKKMDEKLHNTQDQLIKTEENLHEKTRQYDDLQRTLRELYSSRGWKIISFLHKVRMKIPLLRDL
ncbi:MAG: glycosyltransferase [Anaplasmataceae bacterium]|nr:glycosyltransferase [Anaplasmataceae bacterium]